MKRHTKIVLGGIAASFLIVAGTVYAVGAPTVAGHAARLVGPGVAYAAGEKHGWRHGRDGGFRHGRGGGMRHGGLARICGENRGEHLETMIEFADAFLKLEPSQTQAWNGLTAALRAGSNSIGETCATLNSAEMPVKAPEKLAAVETIATAGLNILREVRPAFETFYATLDDKQKAALDGLFNRHRR